MSVQYCLEVIGIVIVIFGLGVSTIGAVLIYRADVPRNDWILSALYEVARRPTHAVFAADDWDPQQEREQTLAHVRQLKDQTKRYEKVSKSGMRWIFVGFIVQVVGNTVMLTAVRYAGL